MLYKMVYANYNYIFLFVPFTTVFILASAIKIEVSTQMYEVLFC